jgi:Delta7-sterol 5-desaturase
MGCLHNSIQTDMPDNLMEHTRAWIAHMSQPALFGATVFYFILIYFGFAGFFLLLGKLCFRGNGRIINQAKLYPGQTASEIRNSMLSICIFAQYSVLILWLYKAGLITILFTFSWTSLLSEMLILMVWNEVHFFAVHSLLHTRWFFRKVHFVHHRSVRTTPFSTYSFHWLEAVLLGSVMLCILPFYSFHAASLLLFPAVSLFFNTMGHSNTEMFIRAKAGSILKYSTRHSRHHTRSGKNRGFITPFLDILFKTDHK